jgi:hypothetical protein
LAQADQPWLVPGQRGVEFTAFDPAGVQKSILAPNPYTTGAVAYTAPAATCAAAMAAPSCDGDECCGYGSFWDNTALFFAADGWRTRADDDYPGNFGFRTGFNSGIGWWDSPIRLQAGASYAGYDLDGRDGDPGADPFTNASVEEQFIVTLGVYKRSDICVDDPWAWGGVIDFLYDDHFGEEAEEVFLRQGRGYIGYALDEANEIGSWFAVHLNWARYISDAQGSTRVRGADQLNFFWHRNYDFGGDTWLYAGVVEEPGEFSLGLAGQAPLSHSVALFGGFTYVIPSAPAGDPVIIGQNYSEAYWNVSFGIVWYPGWKAANDTVSGHAGLPLLPVADNGSFLVKAPTGDL